jgi:hypothetical protein
LRRQAVDSDIGVNRRDFDIEVTHENGGGWPNGAEVTPPVSRPPPEKSVSEPPRGQDGWGTILM